MNPLSSSAAVLTMVPALALGAAPGWKVPPAVVPAQELFPHGSVTLLDGPFKAMQDADHAYLMRLEPDRLLAQFRVEAGLEPKAKPYGGWESPAAPGTTRSLAGHSLGHYLSAISLMYAITGDYRLRDRALYISKEWQECQAKRGDGSLVAFPYSREMEKSIREGKVENLDNYWAPFYTLHKQLAGLRDAWLFCNDPVALDVLIKMSDWCGSMVKDLPDERRERMLQVEHGGMAEVLADVHAITGERRFLDYARLYSHRDLLDPLAAGQDNLTGKHANTQVPKFVGFQRIRQLAGDPTFGAAAANFWKTVVENRSWVNGGNSMHEHFSDPAHMCGDITHDGGPETCNTYNMLRLTAGLYQEKPEARYLDFYENALFNHILPSQAPLPGAGAFVYYTPLRPGYARSYGTDFNSFWCCTGTGMENHARYGEMIYTHKGDTLSVNLFIASQLRWEEQGLVLRQDTRFPAEESTTLTLTTAPDHALTLRIRHPQWASTPQLAITVNGEPVAASEASGGFAEIRRQWKAGDQVRVQLPMGLRVVRKPACSEWAAVFNGPILLAGELGSEGLAQRDYIGPYTPVKAMQPLNRAPLWVAATDDEVLSRIKPLPGRPGCFQTDGLTRPQDVTLAPFYQVHFQRYAIYWQLGDEAMAAEFQRQAAEADRLAQELEVRTVDRVRLGEQQPETDHLLKAEKSRVGYGPLGRHYRALDADGWFTFEMKVPENPTGAALRLEFWGRDRFPEFEVLVNGAMVATAAAKPTDKDEYHGLEYVIPDGVLKAGGKALVRIQTKAGAGGPSLYDLRILQTK